MGRDKLRDMSGTRERGMVRDGNGATNIDMDINRAKERDWERERSTDRVRERERVMDV